MPFRKISTPRKSDEITVFFAVYHEILSLNNGAILYNALSFTKQHVEISDKDIRIIKHCRKLLLYHENEAWKKKNSDNCFNVTMSSYDGREVCELVGTLVLSTLANSIWKENSGLYRDDGLIPMRNENGQKKDRIRKEVTKIFK